MLWLVHIKYAKADVMTDKHAQDTKDMMTWFDKVIDDVQGMIMFSINK